MHRRLVDMTHSIHTVGHAGVGAQTIVDKAVVDHPGIQSMCIISA